MNPDLDIIPCYSIKTQFSNTAHELLIVESWPESNKKNDKDFWRRGGKGEINREWVLESVLQLEQQLRKRT